MIKFLDLYGQYLTIRNDIDEAIANTIRESAYISGPAVRAFELAFASYQNAEHCVGVGNGTDAIEIALEALALPPNSEVIVPANSFIASSEAVTRAGCRVVFADNEADTFTLNPRDVESRISKQTRAIIAVHLYGQPCDMDALGALAVKHELRIIEDCAQAHGAEYNGRRVGAIGDIGTFSFYPGKNLGAYGDGGAILTNDRQLAERCRMIANHGRVSKYDHEFEGRNSRLDGLQAAVLNVKLKHLDAWIKKRSRIAKLYFQELANIPDLLLPAERPDDRHAFHLFVIRTLKRDSLAEYLADAGIQTGIHYPIALPKLAAYSHLGQARELMVANRQDLQLLSLPIGEHLAEREATLVIDAVKSFFGSTGTSTRTSVSEATVQAKSVFRSAANVDPKLG